MLNEVDGSVAGRFAVLLAARPVKSQGSLLTSGLSRFSDTWLEISTIHGQHPAIMRILNQISHTLLLLWATSSAFAASYWTFDDATVSVLSKKAAGSGGTLKEKSVPLLL